MYQIDGKEFDTYVEALTYAAGKGYIGNRHNKVHRIRRVEA